MQSNSTRHSLYQGAVQTPVPTLALQQQRVHRTVLTRAKDDDQIDWDASWARFQKQVNSQVETKTRTSPRKAVSYVTGDPAQDRLRRAERVLVDLWSREDFFKIGAVGTLIILALFIVAAGPPPTDSRCTLPWC